jgi:hypothetical protein
MFKLLNIFQEQVFFTTLRIEATNTGTGKQWVGTGFLMRHDLIPHQEGNSVHILLTCKHVLAEGADQLSIKFHRRNPQDGEQPIIADPITMSLRHEQAYFEHDDPSIDVAAINISEATNDRTIFSKNLTVSNFANFDSDILFPTQNVVFIGYPDGFYDEYNYLPICRHGRIASLPRVDFDRQARFLIDAHVYEGSSGSPVFVELPTNEFRFVGMLGRNVEREVPVNATIDGEAIEIGSFKDPIGLGVIYKSTAILDVVRKAARAAGAELS